MKALRQPGQAGSAPISFFVDEKTGGFRSWPGGFPPILAEHPFF